MKIVHRHKEISNLRRHADGDKTRSILLSGVSSVPVGILKEAYALEACLYRMGQQSSPGKTGSLRVVALAYWQKYTITLSQDSK